jgi:DNA repair protein RecO (recombination protein O)
MTTYYRTKGFIIGKRDKAESDRIFTIFSDDFGKLEICAKAIRKITSKLKSGVDLFSFSEIEFIQGKSYKTLTDANFINRFKNIISNPEKTKVAEQIIRLVGVFVNGQEKDEVLFNLLNDSLCKLDDENLKNKNYNLMYHYFLWNFFSGQGYQPEVSNCVVCREKLNPYAVYFSNKEGGIICGNCAKSEKVHPEICQKINSDIVKILRLISKKDWQTLSKLKIETNSQRLLQEVSNNYCFYLSVK